MHLDIFEAAAASGDLSSRRSQIFGMSQFANIARWTNIIVKEEELNADQPQRTREQQQL
jgi:hypothetical protein